MGRDPNPTYWSFHSTRPTYKDSCHHQMPLEHKENLRTTGQAKTKREKKTKSLIWPINYFRRFFLNFLIFFFFVRRIFQKGKNRGSGIKESRIKESRIKESRIGSAESCYHKTKHLLKKGNKIWEMTSLGEQEKKKFFSFGCEPPNFIKKKKTKKAVTSLPLPKLQNPLNLVFFLSSEVPFETACQHCPSKL